MVEVDLGAILFVLPFLLQFRTPATRAATGTKTDPRHGTSPYSLASWSARKDASKSFRKTWGKVLGRGLGFGVVSCTCARQAELKRGGNPLGSVQREEQIQYIDV